MNFLDDVLNSLRAAFTKEFFEQQIPPQYPEDWNKRNNLQSMHYKAKYPEDENREKWDRMMGITND